MSRDKIAREIMAVTGCKYTIALEERNRRWDARELDAYLVMLRAHPVRGESDPPRCVHCLAPMGAGVGQDSFRDRHACRGSVR